ncbi:hypothetical protein B566_EDAN016025, partial [Ephemera danica]
MQQAGCPHAVFSTHQQYPDHLMMDLATALSEITGEGNSDHFMRFFGRCFVRFFSHFGYDLTVRATGRSFCHFLQNVDNIHLQMRFTYPKMKSPSMFLSHVDSDGVVLVYRSNRRGLKHYLMGQMEEIANDVYHIDVRIVELGEEFDASNPQSQLQVRFRLDFDNSEYMAGEARRRGRLGLDAALLPAVPGNLLLRLFPFGVMINRELRVVAAGEKLQWRGRTRVTGSPFASLFRLRRPKVDIDWRTLLYLQSVMFEVELIHQRDEEDEPGVSSTSENSSPHEASIEAIEAPPESPTVEESEEAASDRRRGSHHQTRSLLLKGQMRYIEDMDAVIFLCSPLLELTFESAEGRAQQLERSYTLLDRWKRRGDELLYSMIPRVVADRLRDGDSPINTCQ